MTQKERKYLRIIADRLPKIELVGGTVLYRKVKGDRLTKKQIEVLRAAYKNMGKDEVWNPKPDKTYLLIDDKKKYHDHYKQLLIAWEEKGNLGVDTYCLSAKNLAATQKAITEDMLQHKSQ